MSRSRDLDKVAPDDPITPTKLDQLSSIDQSASFDNFHQILGYTKTPLSSFLVYPKVLHFIEQDSNETIILALRPHWFVNLRWIIVSTIMFLLPTFVPFTPLLNIFSLKYEMVFVFFWYLAIFAYTFEQFLGWYFDLYIVTNERVIDIDFYNLLNKKFSECDIDNIEDITSQIIGFFPTMFNYGNVLIQTAAEKNEIHFTNVPNPEKIIKAIHTLREHTPKK